MPFKPRNAPVLYTVIMHCLRDAWILLFKETKHNIVMNTSLSYIVCDDRIIIDDMLLFSNIIPTILHFFRMLYESLQSMDFLSN